MKTIIRSRFDSLTSLRGIAALGVVIFHIDVCLNYREAGALLSKTQSSLIVNGYLWVDFFFILSGFVIHHAYRQKLGDHFKFAEIGKYYASRLARIYPVHLATLIILLVVVPIIAAAKPDIIDRSWHGYFDLNAVASNLLLTHSMNQHSYLSWNMVSWSISAEFWSYLTAPLLLPLLRRFEITGGVIAIVSGSVILMSLYFSLGRYTLDITFDYGWIRCLGGFLIGMGLYCVRVRAAEISPIKLFYCASFIISWIVLIFHFDLPDLWIIPAFAGLVFTFSYPVTALGKILKMNTFQYLGRISYSIYMTHGLTFMLFWFWIPLTQWTASGVISTAIFAFAFLGITLLISIATYHFIEEPAYRYFRGKVREVK